MGIDRIGEAAGLTGPAVYRYFDSKDEILATLLSDAMDKLSIRFEGVYDIRERELDLLIRHHATFVVNNPDLVSIYSHEHRSLAEPWRRLITGRMLSHARTWHDALAHCYPDAPDGAVQIAAHASIGLLNSVAYWPRTVLRNDDLIDHLTMLVRHGVATLAAQD